MLYNFILPNGKIGNEFKKRLYFHCRCIKHKSKHPFQLTNNEYYGIIRLLNHLGMKSTTYSTGGQPSNRFWNGHVQKHESIDERMLCNQRWRILFKMALQPRLFLGIKMKYPKGDWMKYPRGDRMVRSGPVFWLHLDYVDRIRRQHTWVSNIDDAKYVRCNI